LILLGSYIVILSKNVQVVDLPMQIKVVGYALGHDTGIDSISYWINLINETLAVTQQKVLYVAKATILHNDHKFA